MNDDPETWLIDNDPAKLLPYTGRVTPEDPDATQLAPRIVRDSIVDPADVQV